MNYIKESKVLVHLQHRNSKIEIHKLKKTWYPLKEWIRDWKWSHHICTSNLWACNWSSSHHLLHKLHDLIPLKNKKTYWYWSLIEPDDHLLALELLHSAHKNCTFFHTLVALILFVLLITSFLYLLSIIYHKQTKLNIIHLLF